MNKKPIFAILCASLLAAAAACFVLMSRYTVVDFHLYPKDIQLLDLRGQDLPMTEVQKLEDAFPQADIRWDIPFQGGRLSRDTAEVLLNTLSAEEAEQLAALPKLRTVRAEQCRDYGALQILKQLRPDVQVHYHVPLGGKTFASTAVQLNLSGIEEQEIALLQYLPYVKTVTVSGGEPEVLTQLKKHCRETGITFRLQVAGSILSEDTEELTLSGAENGDVALLHLAEGLKKIHFAEPKAEGRLLTSLAEALPDTSVTWEKTVFGLTFSQDAAQIDLTEILALDSNQKPGDRTAYQRGLDYPVLHTEEEVRSAVKVFKGHPLPDKSGITPELIAEAEAAMAYFPQAKQLVMCGCELDNEAMADFRERHRGEYKVVWSVDCGEIAPRTDAAYIMPVKFHVYYLSTKQAYNLRYCEEATAVDIGHMNVSDISFVEFMPNLEYLILAHTSIQSIESLSKCPKLKFLEVDHTADRKSVV